MSVFNILRVHISDIAIAKLIIAMSFDDNQPDENAFIFGNYEKCNEFITDLANLHGDQKYTCHIYKRLITYACQGGYKSIIDLIIAKDIEIDFGHCIKITYLYEHCNLADHIMELAIEHFGLPKYSKNDQLLEMGLLGALNGGHLTIVKLLRSKITNIRYDILLRFAYYSGDIQTIEYVLGLLQRQPEWHRQEFCSAVFVNVCAVKDVNAVKSIMKKMSTDITLKYKFLRLGLNSAGIKGNLPVILFILKQPIKWELDYLNKVVITTFVNGNVELITTIVNTCKTMNDEFNPDWKNGFLYACNKGHFKAAQLAISHEEHLDLDRGISLACMSGNYKLMVNIVHEKVKREDSNAILTENQIIIIVRKILLKQNSNYYICDHVKRLMIRNGDIHMLKFSILLFEQWLW